MLTSPAERYLELGLQIGRHEDGTVDAYFGPPELASAVGAAPLVEPGALIDAAEALLEEIEEGWLRDQVVGLRTYAGVLAGEARSYADEVEGCYGIRPAYTDEAIFTAAHERLEALLPGAGSLAGRLERWEAATRVPAEQVERLVASVIDEARTQTQDHLVELPTGEGVALEIVRDVPWMAYNHYLGDLRGRISVNVDLPMSAIGLLHLVLHETYPWDALAAVIQDAGIELDLEHALAVERVREPLRWVEVNAALMLHDAGASEADSHAYLADWGLMAPQLADHLIRFITEPTSRSYVIAYPAGRELCRSYVAGGPDRFGWLLTEQVRIRDLLDPQHQPPMDPTAAGL